MSASEDGDQTLGGADSPRETAGAWSREVGASDWVFSELGPLGGDAEPMAAAGAAGKAGSTGEEVGEEAGKAGGKAGEVVIEMEEAGKEAGKAGKAGEVVIEMEEAGEDVGKEAGKAGKAGEAVIVIEESGEEAVEEVGEEAGMARKETGEVVIEADKTRKAGDEGGEECGEEAGLEKIKDEEAEEGKAGLAWGPGAEAGDLAGARYNCKGVNSDIRQAEERKTQDRSQNIMVDDQGLHMTNFCLVFLNPVRSLLHRTCCNDHILVLPSSSRIMVLPGQHNPDASAELLSLHVPNPQEAELEPEMGPEDAVKATEDPRAEAAEGEGLPAVVAAHIPVLEPKDEAAGSDETVKYQYENSAEEAQQERSDEQKEGNKKQEGPEKDLDPAESKPGKPSRVE